MAVALLKLKILTFVWDPRIEHCVCPQLGYPRDPLAQTHFASYFLQPTKSPKTYIKPRSSTPSSPSGANLHNFFLHPCPWIWIHQVILNLLRTSSSLKPNPENNLLVLYSSIRSVVVDEKKPNQTTLARYINWWSISTLCSYCEKLHSLQFPIIVAIPSDSEVFGSSKNYHI